MEYWVTLGHDTPEGDPIESTWVITPEAYAEYKKIFEKYYE